MLALAPLLAAAPEVRAELLIGNLNIGSSTTNTPSLDADDETAQGFTTGTNAGGYTLESIELFFSNDITAGDIGDLTVTLRSESSDNPGTTLHTLANPASIVGHDDIAGEEEVINANTAATFTAPSGTILAANSTYFVVVEFDQQRQAWGARENGEEPGGAAGWSIADVSHFRDAGGAWNTDQDALFIRVNGTVRAANTPATGAPTISGTAQVGSTLTASTSAISDTDGLTSPTYSYQWIRVDSDGNSNATDISGATSSTYTPVAADVGKKVKVKVSFTDDDGNAEELTSAAWPASGTIVAAPPACAVPTLTDRDQVWTGTLTVGSVTADGGTVYGFASGTGGTSFGSLSTRSFMVGTNAYTIVLAAVQTGGTDDEKLSFATSTEVSSADLAALTLHVCDDGFALAEANVSGPNPLHFFDWSGSGLDWSSVATLKLYLSVPTANPNTPATGVPTVTGTARVGETLTAAITDIADADGLPASFSYQWVRVVSGTETDISGATSSTYALVGADEGNTVRVKVSFTDDAGNAEGPLTSAATASVASPLLSVADAGGTEGGSITFTATLSAASAKTVTATWTASVESGDTAASGDLTGTLTGTLTFAPGDLTKTFTVATAEDMTDENDETFTVTLSSLSNATLTGGTATGTIDDDDGAAVLRIADASAAEGGAIAFTVTLVPASAQTVTVNYATSVATGDSATTGDFTATSGSLTFAPGDTEKTFTVATTGDAADEPDETFTVTLSGQMNATLGDATATGTIEDNDDPPTLSVADASASEGSAVSFTATLSAASGKTVTATWTASVESGDTAASGDLTGTLTGTLTFAAGELAKTFTVATAGDTVDEDDETFTVTLSGLSNATLTGGTATGTIDDDDVAPTLSIADARASEGSAVSFTATLSAASGKPVTATWTASVESGDTAASGDLTGTLSGSLTFAPGERTKTFTVATTEDTVDEDDETFTVTLSGQTNATLGDATAAGTIDDDDAAPTLEVADASASEGSAVSFTATLSAASGKPVTATWTAARNTAESTDLTGALTGTLTFAPGDLTKTFTVATTEDTIDEDDETFTVTLSGLSNATLTGGTATGTIDDDDDPPSVGVADARAEEGDNITFTATLSAASEKTVTVDWSASAESGDTAESGDLTGTLGATLSFAPGDLTKTFTVRAREDNVDEIADETFTVTLSGLSNATLTGGTATGTIEDDDTTTLRVSGPASAVTEGGDAVFTVTLSTPNSRAVEAIYETRSSGSDPATHTEDYVPFGQGGANPGVLTVGAGETGATMTVTTVDDQLDESQAEQFRLVLIVPQAGGVDLDFTEAGSDRASADIADNDARPVVELVVDPASIGEDGGRAAVTARMAGTVRSDRETVVTVLAAAVSPAVPGDFALSGSELRIAAGAADSTGTVTVTAVDNDTDAPDKSVTVSATVVNALGATAPAAKTLPIADDDDSPTVTLALSASSISEAGGTSVLTATLSHPSSKATTVTVTPQAGSFTLTPANGRLTIAAGATAGTGSVTLTAVDNRTDAPDIDLTVTATASNTQGVYDDADGIGLTIADEDAAPTPMLVLSTGSIGEAGGSATVRVTLTHPSSEATTVVVAAAGTVDRAGEFTLADATLTVPAGAEQSSGTATITGSPNDTDAPDQVVAVSGAATNSQGIDGDPEAVELTIADDDAAPTVTLALATNPIAEESGSTAVTASLSHPSGAPTTVTVAAAAVAPTVPGDFSQSGSVLTIAAGDLESTGTVTVTAAPNLVDAVDRTVRVSATAANTQGKAGDPANVNLTIADDDERGFTWFPETMSIEESAATRYYSVALASEPTADVTVTISDPGGDLVLLSPENFDTGSTLALVFTPVNWNVGQRVGVTANADSDSRNETVDLRHTGAGGDYQGYSDTYRVTVADDEKVANKVVLTVDPSEVEEGGGGRQVTVTASLDGARRTQATTVTVTAGPGSAEATDFAVSPASFTLTIPAAGTDLNGSERRTVTLTPTNDDIDEDDETVRFSGTTTATVENATTVLTVDPADVTIADDDTRGVTVSETAVAFREGGSAAWTVVLRSAPTGPVTVTPVVTGDGDVTVTPATLTFTAADWSRAQTVTVEAAEDDDAAGDTATVAHTVADADYGANGVTAGRVAVTVTDNDERTLVLAPVSLRFDEGTSGTYTVALSARPTGTVTVRPSVSDNPDVTVAPASLRFTPTTWETPQTVTVTARGDANGLEDRATVRHAISGADYGSTGAVGPDVPVTVNDVATTELIALSVAPASVPENGRRQTVRVTARVDGAARDTATVVNVQVIGKTASPTDFMASPSALTVTIPANRQEGSATFGLTGTADTLDEGAGETIEVRGSSPSGLDVEPAEMTIVDDDGRGLTVSRTSLTVNEQGTGTYTVRLASQPAGPVTVTPAVKPGGSPDVRFTPARLAFTAVDWSRAQTVTVTAADDADGDGETATLRHTAAGGDYGGIEGGEVVVTVRDNDQASRSVQLSVAPTVVEEDGGGVTVTVTATLDGAARAAATDVALAVTGGTAVAVTDFAAVTGVTVTIPAQQLAGTATFRFSPVDDAIDEGLSETVVLGGTAAGLTVRTATLTIADDDGKGIELSPGAVTLTEEGSATYRVALATQPTGPVTVRVTVSGNRDVTVSPASLDFTADTWGTMQTVTVSAVHDDDAANDTAELRHAASGADYGGVRALPLAVAVTDNDTRGVALSERTLTFREGASATYTVVLDTQPTGTVRVVPALAAGSDADVTVTPSSLSFTTSRWNRAQTVTVRAAHDLDKVADSATVGHAVSGADYGENSVTADDVRVTVTDDDVPSTVLNLSVSPQTVREGASATRLTVTAELDASPEAAATEVTVSLGSGTATSGTDFAAVDDVTLTLPAGQTRATARITLTPVRDAVDEGDGETVRIGALNATTGSTLRLSPSSLEVTIEDDDTRGVALSRNALTVREEGSATWTVRLTSAPEGGDVTVRPSVTGNTDVTVAPASLTFTAVNWSTAQTVTASAADDADGDDEPATVEHRVSGADYGAVTVPDLPVSVDDNDSASRSVQLSVEPGLVEEDGGGRTVTVTATLDGAARAAATDVALAVTGGTAVAVTDFAAVTGVTVTIPAQQLAGTATFRFSPVDDAIDEGLSETVVLGGTAAGLTVRTATLTIADDDGKGIELSPGAVTLTEEGSATYRVALATQPTGPVTVRVTVSGNRDVTVSPASLDFTADTWGTMQTVTVSAVHDDDAANDTAELRHAASGADYGGVRALPLAVAVTDNDTRGVALSERTLTFREGASATYTVVLDTQPTGTVRVVPALAAGSDADVTVTPSSLSFTTSRWNRAQTVTVRAAHDLDKVADSATVGHAVSGADYGENSVTADDVRVTVTDDDVPSTVLNLSVSPQTVREGASATRLTVTAELDASPEAAATEVTVSLGSGTATSGTDFAAVDDVTLTLPAGQTRATARITLTPVRDAVDEGDGETVRIGALNATTGSTLRLSPSSLEVTIEDDDTRGVALSRNALTVREEGSATWTVRLTSAPEGGDVTVRPSVTGNTDVTVAPASLTFTAVNWSTAQTVTASAADDADGDDEPATVEHRVSGADYGAVTVPDLPVSVDDNDSASRSVQLSVEPGLVEEDGGGRTVTVTATLDGAARAAATDVALAVTGGTAVAVTDFAAVTGVTVTIPAQQLTGTATFRFSPVDDAIDEGLSETVVLGGTAAGLTVRTATLTIADDDGKGIELSPGAVTLTEEGSATYRVVLATQPTGPVTVRVTVSGNRDVTVSPASLDFTADTWGTMQTVTVSAVHDDDAANDTAELRHAASGADYGGVRALPLAVAVTDNDTRGVALSERTLTFREGASATYTVVLDTQPTGTVRVVPALAAGSDADVTVTPSSLSFTTSRWNRAQTVTVRAAHDLDKVADSATVGHAVSGADYGENSVTADDVRVTVTDDDVPSTVLNLSVSPQTVREGASATRLTVTAELDASPEAAATEVTVSLGSGTATSGTDFAAVDDVTLTLPAGQTRATARITLTPVRDAVDEGDGETVRIGALNATTGSTLRLSPSSLEVTIEDDDTRGVALSRNALTVREEGSATWTVRLTSAPEGGDVTVRPSVTGNTDVTVAPASLTFTAVNWSTAQTVTASAADDADGDDEPATVEHRVSGADYGAVTVPDLPVSVDDNDSASRSVQLSVEPGLVEEDGGGRTVTVTATLDGAARAAATDVALAVTGGTAVAVTDFAAVTGVTVTIPAQQLTGTATFRFSPVDDAIDEGLSETVVLGGTAAGLTVRTATLTIADDDGKGIELSPGAVTLTEEGSATYRVVLATQPTGPVTVRVTVSGNRDVTVSPASLDFTADTWGTAQTVTVMAAHDDDPLDDTAELRHAASGADYGGVRALPLAVEVTDNDIRGVTLSESALSFDEGASATYTVVLDTRPTGTVRVMPALATGSDADVTVAPSSLSFTTSSWSRAQTVTVRAREDADRVDDSATVEHAVGGADYGENGVTAASLPVTAIDRFSAPDAPTGLTATPFGRNRIDLAWTAPPAEAGGSAIAGYKIEVSVDRGTTWSMLAADTGTDGTAYEHAGLEFGTTRHYRVSTINRLGTSPPSNVASATTDARPVVTFSHRTIPNENGDGSRSPVPRYEVTVTSSQPVRSALGTLHEQAVLRGGRFRSSLSPVPAANQGSGYYTEWKAEIVPSGPIEGGPVTTTLTIPENALRDRAGRLSRANTLRIESELPNQDKTQPQVVIRPGEAGFAFGPFTVDVAFSEPVSGFVQGELRVANGRVTAWEPREGGEIYRATVRPSAPSGETIEVTLNVAAGAARDAGGNSSVEAAELIVSARPRPTVAVTARPKAGSGGDQEVTVMFSEPVTGFTENELTLQKPTYAENHAQSPIGAARVTTFTANADGRQYVFVVRPTRLGYVEATVRANVANDAEGYANLATHSYKVMRLTAIPQGVQNAELGPLVAAFRGAPVNHDGTSAFALELAFDGAIAGDTDDVRDAITVTNGGLTTIAQDEEESRQWKLTITPSSTSDVTVEIAASAPCDEDGALCTVDGRHLEVGAETTIDGPAPVVIGASITSARLVTDPGENGTWDVGETVTAEVTFSAAVTVQGAPTLGVTLDGVRREAVHASGDDTQTVRFSHPVTAADAGATQARLVANGFDTSNGIIGDSDGRLAVLDFAVAPWVTAVAVLADASGDGQWSPGENIEAQLTFSEAVTVTDGTPTVGVTAGGAAKTAPYASGSGTASLVFAYPVTDADGTVTVVALTADSLALNGASLNASASDLAAELGHDGVEPAAETVLPALPVLSVSDAQATEGAGATLAFSVTLAPAATDTVTVHWATADATATAGSDYTAGSGTLAFAPGETAKTVTVAVLDDTTVETGSGETVTLGLSNASGATIANAAATGTIADNDTAPVTPDGALTAQLTDVPSAHAGPFTFLVSFSEALATGAGRLGAASFAATGATVTGVRKLGEQSHLWEVSVRPRPGEDAQVTLAGGRACDAAGAVCSSEGATLSNSVSATVPSAPMLSVSDARAVEGEDASMTFTVTLAPAAQDTVTVDYATGGGSATAGDDYTGVHGRLRFAPGETSKTIEVAVFDDSYDEGEEIFHLVLYLADGAYIADGAGRGTIVNSDPAIPQGWLGRFGRTVAAQAVEMIGSRLEGGAGSHARVGGMALSGTGAWVESEDTEDGAETLDEPRTLSGRELMLGSAFQWSGAGEPGAPGWTAWGRFASGGFEATGDGTRMDGEVTSGFLGADRSQGRWLAGVAVSVSEGEGDYAMVEGDGRGTLESSLNVVYPYLRLALNERVDVWGLAGYGAGALTLRRAETRRSTDIDMVMGAVGMRGELLAPAAPGAVALALKSDALWLRTTSDALEAKGDAGGNLAASAADVSRLRVVVEGSRAFALGGGAVLRPALEAGVRHDGGDAETGTGLEVGAAVRYEGGGFSVEGSVRMLAAHEDGGYEEWGASGAVRIDPGAKGRGLMLRIAPAWGAASSGVQRLWSLRDAGGLAGEDEFEAGRRVEAEVGYGVSGPRATGVVTPYAGLTLGDGDGRSVRAGARWALAPGATLGVEATRDGGDDPTDALMLRARVRW